VSGITVRAARALYGHKGQGVAWGAAACSYRSRRGHAHGPAAGPNLGLKLRIPVWPLGSRTTVRVLVCDYVVNAVGRRMPVARCRQPTRWYGMVWYGAPPTPRQCVLSLRVVASCSVHPVSERHRQAMQSALVRRCVRPCDAGIGKEWNRGCLHETKSSDISLRCTCLALPATRWLTTWSSTHSHGRSRPNWSASVADLRPGRGLHQLLT
jgi:hypothetical protein